MAVTDGDQLEDEKYRVNDLVDLSSVIDLVEKQETFGSKVIEKSVT